jgi:hypothetical protein
VVVDEPLRLPVEELPLGDVAEGREEEESVRVLPRESEPETLEPVRPEEPRSRSVPRLSEPREVEGPES